LSTGIRSFNRRASDLLGLKSHLLERVQRLAGHAIAGNPSGDQGNRHCEQKQSDELQETEPNGLSTKTMADL
jgi:hypothetical protein